MEIQDWLHWGTFFVALIGGAVGFLSAWTAFFIKYTSLQSTVNSLNGAVEEMRKEIIPRDQIITIKDLDVHCTKNQDKCTKALCRKLKVVEDDVKELKTAAIETTKSLANIEHFMGKMEGMFLTGKLSIMDKRQS